MARKIIVDARMIGPIGHGIARYVELLSQGLLEIHRLNALPYQLEMIVAPGVRLEGFRCISSSVPFLHPQEWIEIPKILKREGAHLFHSPSFASLLFSPCPWVVTVHDLNHLHYGSWAQKQYYRWCLKRFVRGAQRVMTVSRFSSAEIQQWMGTDFVSPVLVWNPIEAPGKEEKGTEAKKELESWGLHPETYWLTLAGWKAHKNLKTLLEAYQKVRADAANRGSPVPSLVVTASPEEGMRYEGVRFLGGLSDIQVKRLLSYSARLFVPSEYEGFGRPPLEAWVRGVPVTLSDIPPHREGAQWIGRSEWAGGQTKWLHWVDPRDEAGWYDAMRSELDVQQRTPIPAEVPAQILQALSPQKCAQMLDQVYRDVLGLTS